MSGERKRRHYNCKCEAPPRARGFIGRGLEKAIAIMRKVRMERHVANAKNTESYRRRAAPCCALGKVGRSRVVPRNGVIESEADTFIRVGPPSGDGSYPGNITSDRPARSALPPSMPLCFARRKATHLTLSCFSSSGRGRKGGREGWGVRVSVGNYPGGLDGSHLRLAALTSSSL